MIERQHAPGARHECLRKVRRRSGMRNRIAADRVRSWRPLGLKVLYIDRGLV